MNVEELGVYEGFIREEIKEYLPRKVESECNRYIYRPTKSYFL